MTTEKKLTVRCSDGETFEVEENVALVCQTLKHMIEDDCAGNTIPIPNVNGATFAKVLEYCKKHVNGAGDEYNSKNTSNSEENKELREWDREFANVDNGTLFDLILAANYLNISGLLDLTCQTVAEYIKDKQVEEVRELFNIKNDFTPEEEAAVRSENQWAFE